MCIGALQWLWTYNVDMDKGRHPNVVRTWKLGTPKRPKAARPAPAQHEEIALLKPLRPLAVSILTESHFYGKAVFTTTTHFAAEGRGFPCTLNNRRME